MSMLAKLRKIREREVLTPEQYLQKLAAKGLNKDGTPILDPTPLAPPIGYKKLPSMVEVVRDMVRSEKLAQAAREAGHETFEEAEDFEVGDDPDLMRSQWENEFDPPLQELVKAGEAELEKKKPRKGEKAEKPEVDNAPKEAQEPVPPADGPGEAEKSA